MLGTAGQDRAIAPRFGHKTKLIKAAVGVLAVILVLILLTVAVPAVQRLNSSDMSVSRGQLRFSTVTRGDLQRDIAVEGTIIASNSPGIYAPTSGIINLKVNSGERIQSQQLLAIIDSPQLDNQLIQEKASLEESNLELERQEIQTKNTLMDLRHDKELAEVNVELEKSKKKRADESIVGHIISQAEYEQRVAELRKAEFEYEHAVQNLTLQEENLEFELRAKRLQLDRQQYVVEDLIRQVNELKLISPIDGVVGNVNIRDRDNVAANALLITLVDLTTLEVDLSIPENFADDLSVGMRSEVTFNGESKQGELISLSPEVDSGFVGGRMGFVDDFDGLRQNQRVNVRIILEEKEDILKVRNGAFVDSGGGRIAYVLKDNIATRRSILVGARSIAEVEIASGVQEGDELIISSLDRFNNADSLFITN